MDGSTKTGAFHLPRAYTYVASMPRSSSVLLNMPAGATSIDPAQNHLWVRVCFGTEVGLQNFEMFHHGNCHIDLHECPSGGLRKALGE